MMANRRPPARYLVLLAVLGSVSVLFAQVTPGTVPLTRAQRAYLDEIGPVTMCVDPDWMPFEYIHPDGSFSGIAADLVDLVARRLDTTFSVVPTADWAQTLAFSQEGRCLVIPFLNRTPQREEWLSFTEPLLVDSNVFISREEHPFVGNPADLVGATLVLPEGTSIEEFVRRDYPNITVMTTPTEREAFEMVTRREADLTLRSLIIAAWTIRSEGFFNLKIAGRIPEYDNHLRMGVLHREPLLREILDLAITDITPMERQEIVNRHVYIQIVESTNYRLIIGIGILASLVIAATLWVNQRLRRLSSDRLRLLQEKEMLLAETHHRIKNNMTVVKTLLSVHARKLAGDPSSQVLTDAVAQVQSMAVLYDRLYRSTLDNRLLSLPEYLAPLLQEILAIFRSTLVLDITTNIEPLQLPVKALSSLGIIINELVTNSIKYAFHGRNGGSIHLIARTQGDNVLLIYEDDGVGLPDGVSLEHSDGFGMQLLTMLAGGLRGHMSVSSDQGVQFSLLFPLIQA